MIFALCGIYSKSAVQLIFPFRLAVFIASL